MPIIQSLLGSFGGELSDEYFNYVTMLLHGDGTNGAQNNTFIDSSSNNFTITRSGNTTQGTLSPFGDNWSNYFDGSGDWIIVPNNTATDLSTGDFTIECWINYSSFKNDAKIYLDATSVSTYWQFRYDTTNGLQIAVSGGSVILSQGSTSGWNIGTWYHVALVRSGSSFKIFRNGVTIASSTYASSLGNNTTKSIGGTPIDSPASSNAYISNFRMIKGTALYTSDFTPPTAPLTAISGTSLLTCQSNRFKDNSTNNFTLTPAGNVSVQKFSPFSPTASYNSSTVGGSLYFDGSGDTLTLASNAAFALGTGDFTVEAWIYATTAANNFAIFNIGPASAGSYSLYWLSSTSKFESVRYGDLAGSGRTTNTYTINGTWTHIAAVRSSGTSKLFINGVEDAGASYAMGNITNSSAEIGSIWQGAGTNQGYISNLRVIKGTALYTSNFTPSTAPLTNITNTSLLLNGTNAGIFDNAMMNNLETVGNAQISTTQSKFGGSSMYFDGTGDYLTAGNPPSLDLRSGDFTMEAWIYPTIITGNRSICGTWSNQQGILYLIGSTLSFAWAPYSIVTPLLSSGTVSANQWSHVAVTRSGNTFSLYLNGTQTASTTSATNATAFSVPFSIGSFLVDGNYTNFFTGYIDDLRVTKGFARYTTNFTPPTRAFPNK